MTGFNNSCLSFIAIDQRRVPLFRVFSRKNKEYSLNILSKHSHVEETVASFLHFYKIEREKYNVIILKSNPQIKGHRKFLKFLLTNESKMC